MDMNALIQLLTKQHEELSKKMDQTKHELKIEIKVEIEDIKKDLKISRQKMENLEHKMDNIEARMGQQLEAREEKNMYAIKEQVQHLEDKIESERREDKINLKNDIPELRKQSEHEQERNHRRQKATEDKIVEQVQYLEEQKRRIHVVEDKIEELQHTTNKSKPSIQSNQIHITCTGGNNSENIKFNGRFSNPNEYLKKLRRIYEKNKIKYGSESNDQEQLYETIENSMEGSALQWWQLNKDKIINWKEFEEAFTEKYWNQEIQRHLKQKIDLEKYRSEGRLSRVEYFLERVLVLKSMTPSFSEAEIVGILTPHYGEIIQTAQRVQNLCCIKDFEALLQREDMLDTQKSLQGRFRPRQDSQ